MPRKEWVGQKGLVVTRSTLSVTFFFDMTVPNQSVVTGLLRQGVPHRLSNISPHPDLKCYLHVDASHNAHDKIFVFDVHLPSLLSAVLASDL